MAFFFFWEVETLILIPNDTESECGVCIENWWEILAGSWEATWTWQNEELKYNGKHYCKAAEELCGQDFEESRGKQTASV